MRDDLISRKLLLDTLRGNVLVSVTSELEKSIQEQPTAFDKEKVISEMKKNSRNFYPSIDHYCLSQKAVDLKKAIEIIEKGGVD